MNNITEKVITAEGYKNLIATFGFPKASALYARQVPFTEVFWKKTTILEWRQISAEVDDVNKGIILNIMKARSSSFEDWRSVSFVAKDLKMDLHFVAEKAKPYCQTLEEWIHIRNWAKIGSELFLETEAQIKTFQQDYSYWYKLYYLAVGDHLVGIVDREIWNKKYCIQKMIELADTNERIEAAFILSREYIDSELIELATAKMQTLQYSRSDLISQFDSRYGRNDIKNLYIRKAFELSTTAKEYLEIMQYISARDDLESLFKDCFEACEKTDVSFEDWLLLGEGMFSSDKCYNLVWDKIFMLAQTLEEWEAVRKNSQQPYSKLAEQKVIELIIAESA